MSLAATALLALLATANPPSLAEAARAVAQKLPASADGNLPPGAVAPLSSYRSALRAQADAALAPLPADAAPGRMQRAVLEAFAAQSVAPEKEREGWGAVAFRVAGLASVSVASPPHHPDLRALQIVVGVYDCGDDTMLRVYRHDGAAWRPILAEHAAEIRSIADGLGSLTWALTSRLGDGSLLALTAWDTPWCSSNWHTLSYRAWKVTGSGARKVGQGDFFAMTGEGFEARGDRDSVWLHSVVHQDLDDGRLTRRRILRFSLAGDTLVRRDPVAPDPADFLGEWVESGWTDAELWSETPDFVHHWHEQLSAVTRPGQGCSCELPMAERCSGGGERWHLVLECEAMDGKCSLPEALHFDVARAGPGMRVRSISTTPAPCASAPK
jgi:hypothetical protein